MDPLTASLKIAASGLEAQSARLRVVSENLANARSTGDTPGADPDEPISGDYRVRRGDCTTLVTNAFDLPVFATSTTNSWNDATAPPAGTAWCYNVIDYQDVFGTGANLNGP